METGKLEVITGCMYSGKTTELIRRLNRADVAGLTIEVLSPDIDDRFGVETIGSHDGRQWDATVISTRPEDVEQISDTIDFSETDVVAIDEGNFFPHQLVSVCEKLANENIRVIVSGLDTQFNGDVFEPMPELMALSDHVDKLHAVCDNCGSYNATYTQRLVEGEPAHINDPVIVVGAEETYEARCRNCHTVKTD